jgi:hypothetical protein
VYVCVNHCKLLNDGQDNMTPPNYDDPPSLITKDQLRAHLFPSAIGF